MEKWEKQSRYIRKCVYPYKPKAPYFHYRLAEAAKLLDTSVSNIFRNLVYGNMYAVQVGGELFVLESQLRRFAEAEYNSYREDPELRNEIGFLKKIVDSPPPIFKPQSVTLTEARLKLGLSEKLFKSVLPRDNDESINEQDYPMISESAIMMWTDQQLERGRQKVLNWQRTVASIRPKAESSESIRQFEPPPLN